MSQSSLFWTTGSTGDGASEYTQSQWFALWRALLQNDATVEGVLGGETGNLAVSATSGVITVSTGAAVVYGIPYFMETAATTLAIATPAIGTTGHRVVLRADWTAQTVRAALKSSDDGVSAIPAVTQSSGTTWEVSLASMTITTGGAITTTDLRRYCQFASEPLIARQGGSATDWDTAGSTTYRPNDTMLQAGTVAVTTSSSYGTAGVTFPVQFSGDPIIITGLGASGASSDPSTLMATTRTTSGFTMHLHCSTGDLNSAPCMWVAIGPR